MNFRFTKSRSLISRYYTPRGLYRNSGRYWDYALYPFWDEMNVGVAQGAVQTFVRTPENSSPFLCCNPELTIEPRALRLTTPSASPSSSTVNVHWLETPTAHIFQADVPGLRREDLSILVEGSTLQISGHRNLTRVPTDVSERAQWEVSFVRRFRLPTTAVMEQISAVLDHGVLTLTIPKLPIPPSVAWFVPVSGCPPQVIIRNWNPQEQTQPDSRRSDQGRNQGSNNTTLVLGRCQSESRPQECNLPSSVSVQSLKERDESLPSSSDMIVPIDPKLPSKTLNITQEEGAGPNAKVTLNININTGKVSSEGEASSVQISPRGQMEGPMHLLNGSPPMSPRPSFRSRSISPVSISKPRSSLAQSQDYEAEEDDPPPSPSRRKSSIQIEDDLDFDPPSTSRRKSSMQIEDDEDIDPPPTSRRKSSIQTEDDEDIDPPPTSRRKSSIQTEDDEDIDPPPTSRRKSSIQTKDEEDIDPPPTFRRKSSIQLESKKEIDPPPSSLQRSSIQMNDNQDVDLDPLSSKRQSIGQDDDFEDAIPQPSSSKRKSSIKIDNQGAPQGENMDNFNRQSLARRSSTRGSQRQSSAISSDAEDGEGQRGSNIEDVATKDRRRSSKRGSQVSKRMSSVVANDDGGDEGESTSNRENSMINERRRSSKRSSSIVERKPSIKEDDNEEDTSDMEDWTINKRKGSTKDRSSSQERRDSRRESSTGKVQQKSSLAKRRSIASSEGDRRESSDSLSRRRESSLGLGADLTKSSGFGGSKDDE